MDTDDFGAVFDQVIADGAGDAPADDSPNIGNAKVYTGQDATDDSGDTDLFDESDDDSSDDADNLDDTPDDTDSADDVSSDTDDTAFDWTEHKDKLVEVKVNGALVQVPLGEALNGYLRQDDYTRKTQAIAQDRQYADWAKSLKQALESDPTSVVTQLAQAYGIPLGAGDDEEDDYSDDPAMARLSQANREAQQRLAQQEAQLERLEQERVMNEVKQELADVRSKYDDFNHEVVLPYAVKEGLSIETAYLALKGLEAKTNASAADKARQAAADKAKLEATKRANTRKAVRSQGRPIPKESDKSFDSFEDMFMSDLAKSKSS